jgi:hypothetical protein
MAQFCIATRMSPTEFRQLTVLEFQAFVKILNAQANA